MTYQEARIHAFQIREAVESRAMPPWKPVNAHDVFAGERTLTDEEIETLSDWALAGAPEGKAEDLPQPISFPETWSAGNPDVIVQPQSPFPLSSGSDDIYRCFPMTLDTRSDVYVRGYEVLPGNRAIVHHVLLFIDEFNQSAGLDAADPGPGYTCFGGAGFIAGLGGLGGWVPGAEPQIFPLGTGVRIPAGARVVMQVHYSTSEASRNSSVPLDPDLTRLGLYLSPAPLDAISFLPVVNPFFAIPAGDPHYQVKAVLPIPNTVELVAVAPHMHLLGREVTVDARFPNGSVRRLIRIDDWDFHWQGNYIFREPIILPAGTIVEMTAYYDNSSGNPKNPSNPPVIVRWGERTVDEMCLTFLSVKSPGTPSLNTVPFTLTDRGTESVTTQGGSSDPVKVGYARITDSAGGAPSGLAIYSYRQNGILISESAAPASRLLNQGRIYAETSVSTRTGLAIANPNPDPAVVSFTFTDENGQDIFSSSASIPASGQISAFLNEGPFNGPSTFSGAFSFSSSKPVAVTGLRGVTNERSEFLLTSLAVADTGSPLTAAGAVFPHFADGGGWTTTALLVNPADAPISGELQFIDSSGKLVSTVKYAIPARSARRVATTGFGDSVTSGSIWIVSTSNDPAPVGSLLFTYRSSGTRLAETGIAGVRPATAFRVYVEASSTIQSGIVLANLSGGSATVRLELINLSGASVSSSTMVLPANTQQLKLLNDIPGFQNLRLPIEGLLRITSTAPIVVAGLRSRTNERGDSVITTIPPVPESSSAAAELFFPHFVDGGSYTTQLILFSTSPGDSVNGAIRFYSKSGQLLDLKLK
jgi:hypothetical protein